MTSIPTPPKKPVARSTAPAKPAASAAERARAIAPATVPPDDPLALAHSCNALADRIGALRRADLQKPLAAQMSATEQAELARQASALRSAAAGFSVDAVERAIAEGRASRAQLAQAAADAARATARLGDVKQALGLATAALALVGALASLKPSAALAQFEALKKAAAALGDAD